MATHLTEEPYNFIHKVEGGLRERSSNRYDARRLERIKMGWRFYLAEHWEFEREDGEPLITINHLAELTDKKIAFLVGADWTLNVPPPLAHLTLPRILKAWEDNGRQVLNNEIAQSGSVTGDAFILITVAPPLPEQLRFDPLKQTRVVIQRLNSDECFPEWEENAPNTKYGRPLKSFSIVKFFERLKKGTTDEYESVRYEMQITAEYIRERINEERWRTETNALGEIPVVHIKNKASAHTNFGIDDVTDLIPLNKELNEKATDVSDTINYNAAPVTVLVGARANSLKRGPKEIWSLPLGASAALLRLEGDMTASNTYMQNIKNAMNEIANVPANAIAGDEHTKVTGTTGETWAMQLVPLIDERNKKKATYEPGFERINYFILRYEEQYNNLRLPLGVCEKCGGKIAIFEEPNPDNPDDPEDTIEVRRCFVMDKHTFGFLDPEKMKVPFLRVHSQGDEVTKVPLEQAEEEAGRVNNSYWDMAPIETKSDLAAAYKLPPGFKYPPEPERFDLDEITVTFDDIFITNDDGEEVPYSITVQRAQKAVFAIPVDCDQHTFLNPFTNYVTFNETMPKDKQKQAELMRAYRDMKVVSRAWIMSQIGIENIDEVYEQIQKEEMQEQSILNPPLNQEPLPPGDSKPVAPNSDNPKAQSGE